MDDAGVYICRNTEQVHAEVTVRVMNGKTTSPSSDELYYMDTDNLVVDEGMCRWNKRLM